MAKKKLFVALTVGTLALGAVAATAFTTRTVGSLRADEKEYSVTLNADNASTLLAQSTGGASFQFVAEGLTAVEGKLGTLAQDGYIGLAEGYSLNNLKSFQVSCDNSEAIELSYGFEEGVWVREGLEGWVPETVGEPSLLNERPNYIKLSANAEVTIDYVTFTFVGDGALCTTPTTLPSIYNQTDWQVVGEHQNWNTENGTKFTLNSKNKSMDYVEFKAKIQFTAGQKFKIIKGGDWNAYTTLHIAGDGLDSQVTIDDNRNNDAKANFTLEYTFYLRVEYTGTTYVWIPEAKNPVDLEDETLIKTVSFKAPNNWVAPIYAHLWDNYGHGTVWPGNEMTHVEGSKYSLEYNASYYTNIIFSSSNGLQTDNLVSPIDTNTCYVFGVGWRDADTTEEPSNAEKLYFKPSTQFKNYQNTNAGWANETAWFGAWIWPNGGDGEWAVLDDLDNDGYYEMDAPEATYTNIIFVAFYQNKTEASWDNKVYQTANLKIPTDGRNLFTITEGQAAGANGTWTKFGN